MEKFVQLNALGLINLLKEGDRFMLVGFGTGNEVAFQPGTVNMDGHAVSKHYGWVSENHYFDDTDKAYINVRFDDFEYMDYWNKTHSLYAHPAAHEAQFVKDWSPWGKHASYELWLETSAYRRVLADSAKLPEEIHPELKQTLAQREAAAEIERIEKQMRTLAAELEAARKNL